MFGLSASHLIVLGIVVLLFGARRLPELGASLGSAIRAFKEASDGKFAGNVDTHERPALPLEKQKLEKLEEDQLS